MPMDSFTMPRGLFESLAAYLRGRPWDEVNNLMYGLSKCRKSDGNLDRDKPE